MLSKSTRLALRLGCLSMATCGTWVFLDRKHYTTDWWLGRRAQAFWSSGNESRHVPAEIKPPEEFHALSPLHSRPSSGVQTLALSETKQSSAVVSPLQCCGLSCPGRVADVASRVIDSVVCIRVEMDIAVKTGMFREEPRILASVGSGFCVDKRGLFLTNAHVVSDVSSGASMTLTTSNGHTYPAELHSIDQWSDFAVVRIIDDEEEPSLKEEWAPVRFAEAGNVRLGEWLFTFGHPLGLSHSLTTGIVSSLSRRNSDIDMEGKMDPRLKFIQSNFSGLDFGNSGGAVFNMNGEVVGINIIKSSTDGISFAVHIDSVRGIIESLISEGKVRRPWLGLRMATLKEHLITEIQRAYHKDLLHPPPKEEEKIESKSSTWLSWLGFGKASVNNDESLQHIVSGQQDLQHPDAGLLHLFGKGHTKGLLVLSVFEHSPAAKARIQSGDVITHVNDLSISTSKHFFDVVSSSIEEPVLITVCRAVRKDNFFETKAVKLMVIPEELDVFDGAQSPLNSGDHEAVYEAYLRSLDEDKREKLRFLEK